MVLATERLVLRRMTEADAPFVLRLMNEPSYVQNIGDRGVRTEEDARAYIRKGYLSSYEKHGFGLWLVEATESGLPVGICGLIKRDSLEDVDVGYAFLPEFWSRGFAFESASGVLAYARESLGLRRVVAITSPDNHGSIRLLEKLGFAFERTIRLSVDDDEITLFAAELAPARRESFGRA